MKNNTTKRFDLFQFLYRYGTILVTIGVLVFFTVRLENFMNFKNVTNIFRSVAIVAMMAMAMTISLTVDGFDLSVGAMAGFASVIAAKMMVMWEWPVWIAIVAPLIVGLINSFLIIKIGITDMLTTLSMMFVLTGVMITFQDGTAIYNYMPIPGGGIAPGTMSEKYLWIGRGEIFKAFFERTIGEARGIPIPVVIMLVFAIAIYIFLEYTKFGRHLYMVGGNREAARLSGIPVDRYRMVAYVMSGFIAAAGGLILGARIGSGEVNAGASFLMDSVAAAYIGYSLLGIGKPNAFGTLLGALLMGIMLNGLIMMNFPYYSQDIVKGLVLIFALSLTYYKRKS